MNDHAGETSEFLIKAADGDDLVPPLSVLLEAFETDDGRWTPVPGYGDLRLRAGVATTIWVSVEEPGLHVGAEGMDQSAAELLVVGVAGRLAHAIGRDTFVVPIS